MPANIVTKINIKDDDHTGFFMVLIFSFIFRMTVFSSILVFTISLLGFSLFLVFCSSSSIVVLIFYDCQIYCASWYH